MKEEVVWRGYRTRDNNKRFSVTIPRERFQKLWQDFKNWKKTQREFYFKFVNPYKFTEIEERKILKK